MKKSKLRGHDIEYNGEEWVYSDTKEPTISKYKQRPCGVCGKFSTKKGHDACIKNLPGVLNACCGHGIVSDAFIQFEYINEMRGKSAARFMKLYKNLKTSSKESL